MFAMTRWVAVITAAATSLTFLADSAVGQGGRGSATAAAAAAQQAVPPRDLRPLLVPRVSEMRLVVTRYNADRTLLAGNYAGSTTGGRGGGGGQGTGRGGAAGGGRGTPQGGGAGAGEPVPAAAPINVSPARIARLKRFDLSWQSALASLDSNRLSADARRDLTTLRGTITSNLARLDEETVALSEVMPLLPFGSDLVGIIEARLRHEDIDAQRAAANVTAITKSVNAMRGQLRTGLAGASGNDVRASRTQALGASNAVEQLRSNLGAWFNFYNGYDPLFTWWMGVPFRQADSTLQSYALFLRDSVASANQTSTLRASALRIDPAPAPRFSEVPDLNEILTLPQDEMTGIVSLFRSNAPSAGRGGGGRGAGGDAGGRGNAGGDSAGRGVVAQGGAGAGRGRGSAAAPDTAGARRYYSDWITALRSLNFDRLSRNAQVDYLYIRRASELQLERIGRPLPATNPRKTDNSGITGAARGREGLIRDLQDEFIPYTPEQLITLAEREFAWHEQEMLKASREMGFGDDWKSALEKTKTMHVPPGQQPAMIRDLVFEAIDYLRAKDNITISQVTAESQRLAMMSAERQLVNPFFTGGNQITISYPTDEMDYDTRMQSMRGNNRPWSHATAFHEQVPGHNLVGYYGQRYSGYRAQLGASGPFFGEGWPLYWELVMYDMGFHDTPEERVGALFWRMHRCARIIFSLRFHMGQWSPQEAIDFLVDKVGHERDNAEAEVRRSFNGSYGPLYQAAYLLGGLQLRGLRRELVDTRIIPEKAFHDEIMRQGSMPIALIRLGVIREKLTRDTPIEWKFYGDLPEAR